MDEEELVYELDDELTMDELLLEGRSGVSLLNELDE
jgi:hypothetical protein